jgi:hypothetical protein
MRNLWRTDVFAKWSPHFLSKRVPETPPFSDSGGVLVCANDTGMGSSISPSHQEC